MESVEVAVGRVTSYASTDPGLILSSGFCLCRVLHVYLVFVKVSFGFTGFLPPLKNMPLYNIRLLLKVYHRKLLASWLLQYSRLLDYLM